MSADASGIFSGLNTTPIILAQHNIPNIGKNSAGNYYATFATPLPNADYIIKAIAKSAGASFTVTYSSRSTTGFGLLVFDHTGGAIDPGELLVEISLV